MSERTKRAREVAYLERETVKNRYGVMSLKPQRLDPDCGRAQAKAYKKSRINQ